MRKYSVILICMLLLCSCKSREINQEHINYFEDRYTNHSNQIFLESVCSEKAVLYRFEIIIGGKSLILSINLRTLIGQILYYNTLNSYEKRVTNVEIGNDYLKIDEENLIPSNILFAYTNSIGNIKYDYTETDVEIDSFIVNRIVGEYSNNEYFEALAEYIGKYGSLEMKREFVEIFNQNEKTVIFKYEYNFREHPVISIMELKKQDSNRTFTASEICT